jgi:hypothetical protein
VSSLVDWNTEIVRSGFGREECYNMHEQFVLIDVPSIPVQYVKDGFTCGNHGTWEERDFYGYRQTRYKGDEWRFYITGFCGPRLPNGSDGTGHVLMMDRSTMPCPMDMKGRVRILGSWYSRKHWDH